MRFGSKEEYMTRLNEFIENSFEKRDRFLSAAAVRLAFHLYRS